MMSIQKIKEDLKKKLSSKRYEHTMGVEYTSTCLAMRYGADIEKARLAGLLHDCAKYLSSEEKLSECERYGIPVSAYPVPWLSGSASDEHSRSSSPWLRSNRCRSCI